ncbi:FixH family protein [Mesonia mobilis]|uniref:Cytochrome Cbb3 oxidase maturation protein CcoH n=1 Tax=Mesonia mobilis TaxID=369791 RepID=A0ABQ3C0J1_9FLAO|nr:FixH family protein [Mesonia mobilis]MBQ0736990.1 FixH family protein [Aquimarina celericrescens]GGZ63657.1 cytochrome Cbb3 oxidase maturation protein CcoH [Mesonia mobilis]
MKKLNWGVGIVITIACFIGFIMFFVIKMSTDKKYDHDLVTEEYYKQELAYQDQIDAQQNSARLAKNIQVEITAEGIQIMFPSEKKDIKGEVSLYRPSNKKLDLEIPISLENQQMIIPAEKLVEGKYKLSINWKSNETTYLYKKDLQIRN